MCCVLYNYKCRKLQDISSNESNPISVQKMFVPWYWSVVLSVVGHGTISEQVVLQSISGIGLVGGRGSKIILLAKEIQLRHAVHHRMVSNRSSYILSRIVARVWWERLLFLGPNPKIGRKGSKIIRAYDWIVATLSHGSGDSGVCVCVQNTHAGVKIYIVSSPRSSFGRWASIPSWVAADANLASLVGGQWWQWGRGW